MLIQKIKDIKPDIEELFELAAKHQDCTIGDPVIALCYRYSKILDIIKKIE